MQQESRGLNETDSGTSDYCLWPPPWVQWRNCLLWVGCGYLSVLIDRLALYKALFPEHILCQDSSDFSHMCTQVCIGIGQ